MPRIDDKAARATSLGAGSPVLVGISNIYMYMYIYISIYLSISIYIYIYIYLSIYIYICPRSTIRRPAQPRQARDRSCL